MLSRLQSHRLSRACSTERLMDH